LKVTSERACRIRALSSDPNPRRIFVEIKALRLADRSWKEIAEIFDALNVPKRGKGKWTYQKVSKLAKQFSQGRGPKGKTVRPKKLTPEEREELEAFGDFERPSNRRECPDSRPCPFVGCRYHLYMDVNESTGTIKMNYPHLEWDEIPASCCLDIADLGEHTLEEVGDFMNLTRERIRQIQRAAARNMKDGFLEVNNGNQSAIWGQDTGGEGEGVRAKAVRAAIQSLGSRRCSPAIEGRTAKAISRPQGRTPGNKDDGV